MQTSDENKEKYKLWDYSLIQHQNYPHYKNIIADSKESYYWDLRSEKASFKTESWQFSVMIVCY